MPVSRMARWRMKPDGKEKLRLTDPGLEIQLPFWSPYDTRIAFVGRRTEAHENLCGSGSWR